MDTRQIQQTIAELEAHRALLGEAAVTTAITALKEKETRLTHPSQTQRKQVTVLFADVSGFTTLTETMDAEDASDTMNGLWQAVDTVILAHGGRIDKHMGDAVMALWGVDEAREDDPEQAVHAACQMQTAVATFAQSRQLPLQMRIGLHTGLVLLDQIVSTGEFTAIGDTVNIASRLEHAAPAGGIFISHDTYRHVAALFDVETQPPLTVKGKSEPLQAYRVNRLKPAAFETRQQQMSGVAARTIGREAEIATLQQAYDTAVTQHQTTFITVIGEAGVGKSRLRYEIEKWLAQQSTPPHCFRGRGSSQTRGISHYLWRDVLARQFGILDSDNLATTRQKFEAGIAAGLPDESQMKAHILGAWLGYDFHDSPHLRRLKDDPRQIRDRAALYLAQFFTAVSQQAPTVILLEDVQWADDGFLDSLVDLTRRLAARPLCIISLARPLLYERRPDWGSRIPNHHRLDIHPLSTEQTHTLVAEMLAPMTAPPPLLLELISQRAEGNPFYAEELIKMLIADGVITTGQNGWQVQTERLTTLKVPTTLTGVLQARLDRLPPAEKNALQQAAVVGRVFWDQALAQLAPESAAALPNLTSREFIFPHPDTPFATAAEYVFKHNLLRDVTYETVLRRIRPRYHGAVADWLAMTATANGRADEFAAIIGEHYQQAQQSASAAHWYGRAGELAVAAFAHTDAIRYLTLALELLPPEAHDDRLRLLLAREKSYDIQAERLLQADDLVQAMGIAEQLGPQAQAKVALRQSRYAEATSQYDLTIQHSQQAITLSHTSDDKRMMAEGHWLWGRALWQQGQYAAAQTQYEHGLALAQRAQADKQAGDCLNGLGSVAYRLGHYSEASAFFEQALAIMRQTDDRRSEARELNSLAATASALAAYEAAQQYGEQALHLFRQIGDRRGEGSCLNNLGIFSLNREDYAQAQRYYEQSLDIVRQIEDRWLTANTVTNLGVIAMFAGAYPQAIAHYEQALALYCQLGERFGEGLALSNLGFVYHQMGTLVEDGDSYQQQGLAYSQQAGTIAREIGSHYVLGYALTHEGHIRLALRQTTAAQSAYAEAYQLYLETEQWELSMEPLAGLVQVARQCGDTAVTQLETMDDYLRQNRLGAALSDRARVYLTCYQGLRPTHEHRARQLLESAWQTVQEMADKLPPAMRESYLAIPSHTAVCQAWLNEQTWKQPLPLHSSLFPNPAKCNQ